MSLDQPSGFVKHQTVTRDAFLGGRLTVSQPRAGFRAGLDSVLLGSAVSPGAARLLDLGAGVGTAAMVALRLELAESALLFEREPAYAALARDNLAGNGLSERATVSEGDILAPAAARRAAGLVDNGFDAVIANPPFFDAGRGTRARGAERAGARHMAEGDIAHWLRAAAAAARAGGELIVIYPAQGLGALLIAFAERFGAITILPLLPRPGEPAMRVLVRGIKGSRAPLTLLAGRALHGAGGSVFAPEFDAILRGMARLQW